MTDQHPITPPPELVQQWASESLSTQRLCTQAARWGYEQRGADNEEKLQKVRDEELDACCQALYDRFDIPSCLSPTVAEEMRDWLRAARRPKPPTLGEQAQRILVENGTTIDGRMELDPDDIDTIRAALIRLQKLEALDG